MTINKGFIAVVVMIFGANLYGMDQDPGLLARFRNLFFQSSWFFQPKYVPQYQQRRGNLIIPEKRPLTYRNNAPFQQYRGQIVIPEKKPLTYEERLRNDAAIQERREQEEARERKRYYRYLGDRAEGTLPIQKSSIFFGE